MTGDIDGSRRRKFWLSFALNVLCIFFLIVAAVDSVVHQPTKAEIRAGSPQDTYGMSFIVVYFFSFPISLLSFALAVVSFRNASNRSHRVLVFGQIGFTAAAISILLLVHFHLKTQVLV